jgi:HK97 gp10 family phage protein
MGVKISVESKNPQGYDKYVKSLELAVKKALLTGANLVRNTAITSITKGGKSGAIRGKHRASAPGEPPASDTGFLVSHIFVKPVGDGLTVDVFASAKYAKWLEFGTNKMQPRPFLFPALEENKPKIRRMLQTVKGKP